MMLIRHRKEMCVLVRLGTGEGFTRVTYIFETDIQGAKDIFLLGHRLLVK